MYADKMSPAMAEAIEETEHRRKVQKAWNEEHGITPTTIKKEIEDILEREIKDSEEIAKEDARILKGSYNLLVEKDRKKYIKTLEKQMMEYAENLQFEKAAVIRDEIQRIKDRKDLVDG